MDRTRKVASKMEVDFALRVEALRDGSMLFFLNGVKNANARDLIEAVIEQDTPRLKKILSASGSWPDGANLFGLTPLMMAAARGYAEGVALLSAHPLATLDRAAENGWTALHFAAHFGEAECARTLLRRFAARDVKNDAGKTPEEIATGGAIAVFAETEKSLRRAPETAARCPSAAPVRELSPIDACFRDFTIAAGEGNLADCAEASKKLLDLGVDTSVFHYLAQDGLRAAVQGKADPETIAWLVQLGGRPDMLLTEGRKDVRDIEDPIRRKTFRFNHTVFNEACLRNDAKALRELVLWHDSPPDRDVAAVFSNKVQGDFNKKRELHEDDKLQRDMMSALSLADEKRRVRGLRPDNLRNAFNDAVRRRDENGVAACWVESRQSRFFRGKVDFRRVDSADALAVMLLTENYSVAQNMLAAGVSLAAADRKLTEKLDKKADPRVDDILRSAGNTQKPLKRVEDARERKARNWPPPPYS